VDNFSRPRQPSIKRRNDSPKPLLQNATSFPVQQHSEGPTSYSAPRDRGPSVSSTKSVTGAPSQPLRPSASIPDYQTPDSIYSRQRNLNNSSYRPGRVISRPDSNYSAHRRDPMRSTHADDDEVRASFRSALTTNSSFLGTSGTERSSIMTKSSSATSIFGRDEGMSVDDAIGMYEGGFQDSGTEGDYGPRPRSVDSERRIHRLEEAMNDSLNVPSNVLVRDSAAMFSLSAMNTPSPQESGGQNSGTLEAKESYFADKPPSRPPTRAAPTTWDDSRDRYGFRKNTQHVPLDKYEAWNAVYVEHLARRRKKWVALMKDHGLSTDSPEKFPPKSVKVKRFVRKGIPPEWRGAAWFFYAGGPTMVSNHQGVYEELTLRAAAGEVSETDDEIIERDLNRTFPDNIKFKPDPHPNEDTHSTPSETPILQSLRRVLQAFAIYNPKIGYCQSLNFLAGLLLLFMNEEKSFWMLNIITRVYLPGTHEVNLEGANVDLGVLMTSVKDMMPQIWAKIGGELDGSPNTSNISSLSTRLPPITLCTTAWFMSCFIGTLPIETTLRVWDSFFYEGSKTLFRIALTIFKVGEVEIKAVSDPMEIFQTVQTIPRKLVDANALLEACFKRRNGFGHLSQEAIEKGRAQRRKGYADERARAAGGV
ncbi:rab-GTPase-TBC domain-containing protein, partial [Tricladium varicosporioides]